MTRMFAKICIYGAYQLGWGRGGGVASGFCFVLGVLEGYVVG